MLKLFLYSTLALGVVALWSPAFAAGPSTIVAKAETKDYRLELAIGRAERMYTKAEAATLHPKGGEIMVSGTMADMASGIRNSLATTGNAQSSTMIANMQMAAPAPSTAESGWQHLELRLVSKATGKPVQRAKISITVTNTDTNHHQAVPIAVMYGVQEGEADWHYGNNVMLPAGAYRVDVAANGEIAAFNISIPGS
jgi:hypothetical protein